MITLTSMMSITMFDRKYFVKQRRQHSRNKNDNYSRQAYSRT